MRTILCNKYELLREIAEGGMGCVYLVRDLHLNRLAAIKIGRKEDERTEQVLLTETAVLKKLNHPGLPRILDCFEDNGRRCIVMEYVEGMTLQEYLRKSGTVPYETAVRWMLELTDVIAYLHSLNPPILYRDLKPSNIILQPDGSVKLIDLGGACLYEGSARGNRQLMMGTPGYSAPEQWQYGRMDVTGDIYSLGAVFHEMLTGFQGNGAFSERRPVQEYNRGIPRSIEQVIQVCLQKKPADRYPSANQLKHALQQAKEGKKDPSALWFAMQKTVVTALFILAAGSLVIPLLQGVPEAQFPFPFLYTPVIIFAGTIFLLKCLIHKRRKNHFVKRQERSLLLTEKPFPGIFVSVLCMCMLAACSYGLVAQAKESVSAEVQKNAASGDQADNHEYEDEEAFLFVELRDEQNRKILLQDGAVLPVSDCLRLEIDKDELPQGNVTIQIHATGEDGTVYESRAFLINKD